MTISEMMTEFDLILDRIDSLSYPDLTPEEKKHLLDLGASDEIKSRYEGSGPRNRAFEQSRKRTDDLRLIVKSDLTIVAVLNPNLTVSSSGGVQFQVYEATFPTDYWFLLKHMVRVNYEDCKEESAFVWKTPKETEQDDIFVALEDPFNRPSVERPLTVTEGNLLQIYVPDNVSISSVRITYIKKPRSIEKDPFYADENTEYSELSSNMHNEVVRRAVNLALASIGDVTATQLSENVTNN